MEMKIVPFEKMEYKDDQIGIDETSIQYIQNGDCTEERDNVQSIQLSLRNNGVARFVHLKTEGWSIDDIDSLVKLINDFKVRSCLM